MAMELPLFNPPSGADHNHLEASLNDNAFLQQLLGGPEDDLLTSLLESANANSAGTTEPPLNFDFDILNVPTSPVASDASTGNSPSYTNQANSPGSLTSGSDGLGYSPLNSSPSPYLMQPFSSSMGMSEPTLENLMAGVDPLSGSNVDLSSDIKIDVDHMTTMSELSRTQEEAPPEWNASDLKAHILLLTEEEKKLLAEEGVNLPSDMPLTKAEQKHLKRVRRKIKNKVSAQESRKRKKEYVDGLENRVKICTGRNRELKREVDCLKKQNVSLMSQLRKFQALVAQYNPSKVQAGSVLLVIVMSFSMFFVPKFKHYGGPQAIRSMSRSSRTLLFTETDEFGNVIDPDNGLIISRVGGQSPNFPPPWVYQTPALFSTRPGLPDEFETRENTEIHSSGVEQTETEADSEGLDSSNRTDNSKTTFSDSEQDREL